ncbi:MAG: GHMP kinase [Flavobacteriaceae bacterium]|nr:GHMP kinase [Flavobacteriaceae bacterium]
MDKQYSNGKLLLTAEYLVLDGAKSLAMPTKFGQDLTVKKIKEPSLIWESFDDEKNCWFSAEFRLPDLRIISETFDAKTENSKESIALTLQNILLEAQKMNLEFLISDGGFLVKTNLTFPRDWGLGTSSTLINNIAQWAKVDAFELLKKSFGGSGYDIACAQNDSSITFQLQNNKPIVEMVDFNPSFKDQLYFVHLNIKQDSKKGIQRYKEKRGAINEEIERVSEITNEMIGCNNLSKFEKLIIEHEQIISKIIQNKPVKEILFPDYFGVVKSLGAWGGDFVLVTGDERTPMYFKGKGFGTVIRYRDMIL